MAANLNEPLQRRLTRAEALERQDEGCVVVLVKVDLPGLLDAARSVGDDDEYDYVHNLAFDSGLPYDPSLEVAGSDEDGALYLRYLTGIEGWGQGE